MMFWGNLPVAQHLLADKEVALAAVKSDGCIIGHLSEELRGDVDVITAAVSQTGNIHKVLPLTSLAFRDAFERNPELLPEELRDASRESESSGDSSSEETGLT